MSSSAESRIPVGHLNGAFKTMIKSILFIGGSLGLFLYGMRVMSDGLQ